MNPETYVQKALAGDFGQTARVDAEGAITDAVDRGYDDDAERVAATLDAMLSAIKYFPIGRWVAIT